MLRQILQHHVEQAGYRVFSTGEGLQGLELFRTESIDLVVCDIQMPTMDGYDLIARLRAMCLETPIIAITVFGSIDSAVQAMKLGADDYITKPFEKQVLLFNIGKALERRQLLSENRYLKRFVHDYFALENIIGSSEAMNHVYEIVQKVARTHVSIILMGESGTGKELLAKAVHQNSPRSERPFVVVNCAAIPEGLIESEFFGHKKGAFTSAHADAKGKLEMADGGTLFLDEIAELPLAMQAKLLRVLQDGEFVRLGDTTVRHTDVRIIAATNRDLTKMVADKTFRDDLYFRLNIVPITLPPLRKRREDIPLLADYFLKDAATRFGKPNVRFDKDVFSYFERYAWPGNIRELKNTIERMVVLANGDLLVPGDLPAEIREFSMSVNTFEFRFPETGLDLEEVEKEIVLRALERNDWNQTATSKYLNVTRSVLMTRMQRYGLVQPANGAAGAMK